MKDKSHIIVLSDYCFYLCPNQGQAKIIYGHWMVCYSIQVSIGCQDTMTFVFHCTLIHGSLVTSTTTHLSMHRSWEWIWEVCLARRRGQLKWEEWDWFGSKVASKPWKYSTAYFFDQFGVNHNTVLPMRDPFPGINGRNPRSSYLPRDQYLFK